MGTSEHVDSFGPCDLTLVISERPSQKPSAFSLDMRTASSFEAYKSHKFLLHRKIVCEGKRSSATLQTALAYQKEPQSGKLPYHHLEFHFEMTEQEASAFPRLLDYIYYGTPFPKDKSTKETLLDLAGRFGIHVEHVRKGGQNGDTQTETCFQLSIPSAVQRLQLTDPPEKDVLETHPDFASSLPELCQVLRDAKDRDVEEKLRRDLKTALASDDVSICSFVSTRNMHCLLDLLSDEIAYLPLALDAARLVTRVAESSEEHAKHLVTAQAVDRLLTCQLVHGIPVRNEALRAIGAIASHSKELCNLVIERGDCLKCFEMALEISAMSDAAVPGIFHISRFFPVKIASENIVNGLASHLDFSGGSSSLTGMVMKSLAKFAMVVDDSAVKDAFVYRALRPVCLLLNKGDNANAAFLCLSQFISKEYLLTTFLDGSHRSFFVKTLWSPEREIQSHACVFAANLAIALRRNEIQDCTEWINSDVLPPLVKMLHFRGTIGMSAAAASSVLIRLNADTANLFVKLNGVPRLCELLQASMTGSFSFPANDEDTEWGLLADRVSVESNILVALQTMATVGDTMDTIHAVGANFARIYVQSGKGDSTK